MICSIKMSMTTSQKMYICMWAPQSVHRSRKTGWLFGTKGWIYLNCHHAFIVYSRKFHIWWRKWRSHSALYHFFDAAWDSLGADVSSKSAIAKQAQLVIIIRIRLRRWSVFAVDISCSESWMHSIRCFSDQTKNNVKHHNEDRQKKSKTIYTESSPRRVSSSPSFKVLCPI